MLDCLKKVKLFNSLLILSCFFVTSAYAKDACENISGTWKGIAHFVDKNAYCQYDTIATFQSNDKSIQMDAFVFAGRGGVCPGKNISVSGTCQNGIITFNSKENFKGTIYGNSLLVQSASNNESKTLDLFKK